MAFKFIKVFKKLINRKNELILSTKETEWANYYHDSIRGVDFIEKLNLNVGRWAGNYTFFYLLNRILSDYQPKSIIEFGLGESTKFISSYISNKLHDTQHVVIEHNTKWKDSFLERFSVSNNSVIDICELKQNNVKGYSVNSYNNIEKYLNHKFDLYIVDGPFGSYRFSRYDIVKIVQNFEPNDEFIIIIDDYDRRGEKETTSVLISLFKQKRIPVFFSVYEGRKSVAILATTKYKYTNSL